jgi:hypothetical protein
VTDPLTLAAGEDRLSDLHAELENLRAEVQAHYDGIGHLAEDPMHAGQPVHEELNWADGEPHYWLQVTHQDMPLWTCAACQKVTLTVKGEPQKCAGCGAVESCGPLLYQARVYCRSSTARTTPNGGRTLTARTCPT